MKETKHLQLKKKLNNFAEVNTKEKNIQNSWSAQDRLSGKW